MKKRSKKSVRAELPLNLPFKSETQLVQARVCLSHIDVLKANNVDIPEFLRECFKLAAERLLDD